MLSLFGTDKPMTARDVTGFTLFHVLRFFVILHRKPGEKGGESTEDNSKETMDYLNLHEKREKVLALVLRFGFRRFAASWLHEFVSQGFYTISRVRSVYFESPDEFASSIFVSPAFRDQALWKGLWFNQWADSQNMQDSQGRGPEMRVQEQIWYKIHFAGPIWR